MLNPIPMTGFVDRQSERDALIDVHKRLLAAVLEVVRQDPNNEILLRECVRFFDESLWAVTEITPGRKYDTQFVSKGVKEMIEEHNKAPRTWRYDGPYLDWKGRTDPRTCAEHDHVVPRQQLRQQLFAVGPDIEGIEDVLRRARGCIVTPVEHLLLKPHADVPSLEWERYVLAPVAVWDRTLGDWVKM